MIPTTGEYFQKIDREHAFPDEFVTALTKAGWLSALIPEQYGGSGLGLAEASVIMEEINRAGGNSGACHGQMYNMGTGMSVFIVDLRDAIGHGLTVSPIANMVNHETNELFFENLEIPEENLIGQEGQGFKYILDGLNAERTLIAAECIGDGRWFIDRVSAYVKDRVVFGRPIGQNQGVQFPIAEAHIEVEAADLMRWQACTLYDAHQPCGAQANMAKYLAAKASWEAANACIQFHGGFGFACEYDVERKFRETRLYQVAPISTNMILSYVAEHVLGLPRSF
ncbi:MAG: acyl-CoA dehydrogenase [Betaproteobacteria bacterium]|nr:acyl-CoA dehydrogenase [Betaproteobacteria bacterium]